MENLLVESKSLGDVTIIKINERKLMDQVVIEQVVREIDGFLAESSALEIIIDLIHVDFLSSSFLGALVRIMKSVKEKGGVIMLCHLNLSILNVFKMTKLDQAFHIFNDYDDALASRIR